MRAAWLAILLTATGIAASGQPRDLVRERRIVKVAGVAEEWRLEWTAPPQPECQANGGGFYTCPCVGFAFGERGPLDLVRHRPGASDQRLDLAAFFDAEAPGGGDGATLPRWPVRTADVKRDRDPALVTAVRSRPEIRIMNLADFDHDGQATEFFVQVVSEPCGKRIGVAVGLSRAQPVLHALSSVAHPEEPLTLRLDQWQRLARTRGPFTSIELACGDHASSEQYELTLSANAGRIDVTRRVYACSPGPEWKKGPLLRTEAG